MTSSIERQLAEYRIRHGNMLPTNNTTDVCNTTATSKSTSDLPQHMSRFRLPTFILPAIGNYLRSTQLVRLVTDQSIHHPYACLVIKVSVWLLIWMWFITIGFGAVFFVLSALYALYASLGTRPKDDGAPSAYSVFNKNCERIDGTFTAEQFEKELLGGPFSVH